MKKHPTLFTIGSHTLQSPLLLAPMAGVSDAPFRNLCLSYGAGLATCEMVSSDSTLWKRGLSRLRLVHGNRSHIACSMQIVGSEPAQLASAAVECVANGADIVDINMGCPAKKVCRKAAGSALMRDEKLVESILRAVVAAVAVPVTLKIRTGWDSNNRNAVTIARMAEDCGIRMLAIHGRTRACRFEGHAEYDTIADVVRAVSIPVVANGDIDSAGKAQQVLRHTGAAGIMIGRAAMGRPWLFRQVSDALAGKPVLEPNLTEKISCMTQHVAQMHRFHGETTGLRLARKHVARYLEHLNLKQQQAFYTLQDPAAQLHFLQGLAPSNPKGQIA